MFFTIEHSFYRVVNTSQVGRFDLCHVASFSFCEVAHILKGITPFISHNLSVSTDSLHVATDSGQCFYLSLFFSHIYWPFHTQFERFCHFCQFGDILGNAFEIIIENNSERSVHIYVEHGLIVGARSFLNHSIAKPFNISADFLTLPAHFVLYVIE